MKKTLSLLLVLAMVLSSFTAFAGADTVATEVKTHTPFMQGVGGNNFAADKDITRQEVAVTIARALELEGGKLDFNDADKIANWAAEGVAALQEAKIVKGDNKGNFNPEAEIDRASLATMLVRAYENIYEEIEVKDISFEDVKGNEWYAKDIKKAASIGIVKGNGKGNFNPTDKATRAEIAIMVNRLLGLDKVVGADKLETKFEDADKWPSWAKEHILVASTEFSYTETEDGKIVVVDKEELEEKAKVEEATKAVEKAEESKLEEDIEAARELVEALKDEEVKKQLNDRLDAIEVELKVVEVSAINNTGVDVVFKEGPEEDLDDVTIEVLDNKGNVVEVEPITVAAGETEATFKFVKAIEGDMEGVWTIGGVKYDFDLKANLEAFINADNQIKLNKVLADLGIENVKVENMPDYEAKKGDFLDKLAEDKEELTVEAIQAWVDKINADAISAEEEAVIVKAVVDAKKANNQIAFAQALQNDAFVRVNPKWITDYYKDIKVGENGNIDLESKVKDIQVLIDGVNDQKVTTASNVTDVVDRAKLLEAKALIEEYATPTDKGEQKSETKTALKNIDIQLAVVDVREASTPTRLKNALIALDDLLDKDNKVMVEKGEYKGYIDAYAKDYLTAIAEFGKDESQNKEATGVLNADNVKTAINSVNVEKDRDAEALKINFDIKQDGTNGEGYTTLGELKDGVITVTGDYLALKEYPADNDTPPATAKWIGLKIALKDGDNAISGNPDLKLTLDGDDVREFKLGKEYDNQPENEVWYYFVPQAGGNTKTLDFELYDAQGKLFKKDSITIKFVDELSEAGVVVLVNEAKTAEDVDAALLELPVEDYLNIPKADRLFVAEKVLEARNEVKASGDDPAKQFKDYTALTTALTSVIGDDGSYTTALKGVNELTAEAKIADVIKVLEAVDPEGFAKMTNVKKAEIAEAFFLGLEFDEEDSGKVSPAFRTLAAVKAAAGL